MRQTAVGKITSDERALIPFPPALLAYPPHPQNTHPHVVSLCVCVCGWVCVLDTSVNQSITSLSSIDRQTLTKTLLRRSLHSLITITRPLSLSYHEVVWVRD